MGPPEELMARALAASNRMGHTLGPWVPDISSWYTTCVQCGLGVVVDQSPMVEWLSVDGDSLRERCVSDESRSRDRLVRHRSIRLSPQDGLCGFCCGPSQHRYCGPTCAKEANLRASPKYVRKCLLERDSGACCSCGSTGVWHAHHVVPVASGGGYCGLDNYITLCVKCHRRQHASSAPPAP
jgi:5-methylcytosine-specific restriction protein A